MVTSNLSEHERFCCAHGEALYFRIQAFRRSKLHLLVIGLGMSNACPGTSDNKLVPVRKLPPPTGRRFIRLLRPMPNGWLGRLAWLAILGAFSAAISPKEFAPELVNEPSHPPALEQAVPSRPGAVPCKSNEPSSAFRPRCSTSASPRHFDRLLSCTRSLHARRHHAKLLGALSRILSSLLLFLLIVTAALQIVEGEDVCSRISCEDARV